MVGNNELQSIAYVGEWAMHSHWLVCEWRRNAFPLVQLRQFVAFGGWCTTFDALMNVSGNIIVLSYDTYIHLSVINLQYTHAHMYVYTYRA